MIQSTIKLTKATKEQQTVIAQLCKLYSYEMTDLADFDIHDNGYYRYEKLPLYWLNDNKHPFNFWLIINTTDI